MLNTFGSPQLVDGDRVVALQPLPVALLVYLAIEGPCSRQHLAEMFWPESTNGLNSLSTTLTRIRRDAPGALWARTKSTVGSDLKTDLDDLNTALEENDVRAAVWVYQAPFLETLSLRRFSIGFEEWIVEQRATVASRVELSLLDESKRCMEDGDPDGAADAAELAWEVSTNGGFPSPDYFPAYHHTLSLAARPLANAVRAMASEFGIDLPVVAPTVLEPISGSTEGKSTTRLRRANSGLGSAPQLFGFETELRQIADSVTRNRMTTVIGLGGSGKTRLATEHFISPETADRFTYRYWVSLRSVRSPELVGPAIAASCGQRFSDAQSLTDHVPEGESVLIVLDNFEHLDGAAGVVAELMQGNQEVRVVVTSRVPTGIDSEVLVHLDGLEIGEHQTRFPAEELLVSSARRAGATEQRLGDDDLEAIRAVCRRVGGNPLALELAGGWFSFLSPSEVLKALTLSHDVLASIGIEAPRSISNVLQQSWSALAETDQQTLMLLACFPGGCPTTDALTIEELSIRSIGLLVQHSLIRLHVEGRITLQPLVADFALRELSKSREREAEFHGVLSDWCEGFVESTRGRAASTHAEALAAELTNLSHAWICDAKRGRWALHNATIDALRQFFVESGRLTEGLLLFEEVGQAMWSNDDCADGLLALVLEAQGALHLLAGAPVRAGEFLDGAWSRSSAGDRLLRAQILRTRGSMQLGCGEIDDAIASFNDGLEIIATEPAGPLRIRLLYDLAQTRHYRGEKAEARQTAREVLDAARAANDPLFMTLSYLLLGDIEVEANPQRAVVLLAEGQLIATQHSLDHLAMYFPHVLGLAHLHLDRAEAAIALFTEGIQAAESVGHRITVSANHIGRAKAHLMLGVRHEAVSDLELAVRLAVETDCARYLMWAAVVCCQAAIADGTPEQRVAEVLTLVLEHEASDQETLDGAAAILLELTGVSVSSSHSPSTSGAELRLDEFGEQLLELLACEALSS